MSSTEKNQFSPTESALFYTIAKNLKDDMAGINWDEVVANTGFKNPATAKTRFKQILKKYEKSGTPFAPIEPRSTVKKPRGRVGAKGKKATTAAPSSAAASPSGIEVDDDSSAEFDVETPTKKAKEENEEEEAKDEASADDDILKNED